MQDTAGLLRHSIRGTINALKLGVSAMDTGLTKDESIEFLDYIIQAADKMQTLLDQYDSIPQPSGIGGETSATISLSGNQ